MKLLDTEKQTQLVEFLERLCKYQEGYDGEDWPELRYWVTELKPKRVRKKTGLDLNTEEGVIEQAYQEHTGNF